MESKEVYKKFLNLTEGKQKEYSKWIMKAKTVETKTSRMLKLIEDIYKLS